MFWCWECVRGNGWLLRLLIQWIFQKNFVIFGFRNGVSLLFLGNEVEEERVIQTCVHRSPLSPNLAVMRIQREINTREDRKWFPFSMERGVALKSYRVSISAISDLNVFLNINSLRHHRSYLKYAILNTTGPLLLMVIFELKISWILKSYVWWERLVARSARYWLGDIVSVNGAQVIVHNESSFYSVISTKSLRQIQNYNFL